MSSRKSMLTCLNEMMILRMERRGYMRSIIVNLWKPVELFKKVYDSDIKNKIAA